MSRVFSIYLIDSRGISMRYTSKPSKQEAESKAKALKPLFPSLKAIEIREESRSSIV